MTWDPEIYLKFGSERTRPATELLTRIPVESPQRVIDLGCGPGNSTALLAARWPRAELEGLESSLEMLAKARASGVSAKWIQDDLASWSASDRYDVVFSNATLHWISNHRDLLSRLMHSLTQGGVLAFQIPRNFDAPSHVLMREVADTGPWSAKLTAARTIHVEEPDTYFDILTPLSQAVDLWETTYFHVLEGEDPVLTWVSGTGLRPFLEPLDGTEREAFLARYRVRLQEAYPRRRDGKTILPFKRLFVVAQR